MSGGDDKGDDTTHDKAKGTREPNREKNGGIPPVDFCDFGERNQMKKL